MGRTVPPYRVKLRIGVSFKGYVPRLTPEAIQVTKEEVVKMKRADLIEESDSPYSAPTVVVPKPDGVLRVCIDFRQVNMGIVNNAYLMYRIEDHMEAMTGSRVFTTLDLKKGYHQLMLHEESKTVIAFSTHEGLYQWKVLPLGMKKARAVFQRIMNKVMEGLENGCVAVYIEDITVYNPSIEQNTRDLEKVLQRQENASLRVSVSKTNLARDSILVL